MRERTPAYSSLLEAQTTSLEDLQGQVLRPGEVLVSYVFGCGRLIAFVAGQTSVRGTLSSGGERLLH